MKSDKHVVWVTPGFAPSERDDAAMPTIQNLALEFKRAHPELELTIVSLHFPLTASTYFWNSIIVHGLGWANAGYPMRFFLWKKAMRKLHEIHSNKRIDVIHSFWYSESALLTDYFAKRLNIPHVCSVMGQDVHPGNRYSRLLRNRKIFTVGISERSSEMLRISCGREVDATIAMGIEPVPEVSSANKVIDIIGVGSQSPVKRWDKFLTVIAIVVRNYPKVIVQLVGDGPESENLTRIVIDLSLQNNVTFAGRLSRSETLVQMQKSRILLHTSETEGMGYIFPEAAACSCYIASTPVGIVEEDEFTCVSDENGKLAEQICKWLGANADAPARCRFTIENTANSYHDIYEKLIVR